MVLNLLATVTQWEREVIGERTKAALQHLKRQGRRTGAVPYGRRLVGGAGKQLEPDPAEQAVIALARELRAAGNTLQAICDELTDRGHLSRTGRPFAPAQVSGCARHERRGRRNSRRQGAAGARGARAASIRRHSPPDRLPTIACGARYRPGRARGAVDAGRSRDRPAEV